MFHLEFEDLIDKKKYFRRKYFFLIGDYKHIPLILLNRPQDIEVDYECDYIERFADLNYEKFFKERKVDFKVLKNKFNLVELNFYDDELIPEINKMYLRYRDNFISEIEKRNIFESSGIENFSKKYLNYLEDLKEKLNNADHLIERVKNEANISIEKIYHFVSNEFYQNFFKIPQKIPFNLNKNQLIVLFHQLYENGVIAEEIKPTDLSRLVEQYCTFYDKESNSFLDVKRARDLEIRIFKQDEEPNPEPSIKHLESIFFNPKFYDY